MLKKVFCMLAVGFLISYPLVARALSVEDPLPKPSKLGTLRIAVDQETGVTYSEILRPEALGERSFGECSNDLTLDMPTMCPTCNNCPNVDPPYINEILLLSFCFTPSDTSTKVLPTAGQKYGFALVNPQYVGSATAATPEIVCHQEAPAMGYEFAAQYHCAVAISVEVNSCAHFEVWYDVMGTVSP
jgi:hypothetical protein